MAIFIFALVFSLTFFTGRDTFSSTQVYDHAGGNGHDSLLFDGANDFKTIPSADSKCRIMVTYAYGSAEGTFYKTEIYDICGEVDTSEVTKKGELVKNNELKEGEDITTGDNSYLELEFWDGSQIRMGPNSKVKITGDMCDRRNLIEQTAGKVWHSVKKLLGSQKYEVKTERNGGGVRGTKFSFEITKDEEIIKVFEGSFEVNPPRNFDKMGKDSKEMEQLTKDYQAGKLTVQEYSDKMQVYMKNMNDEGDKLKSTICEAGYMVKVTDKVSVPELIGADDDKWFEDSNFYKK